MTITKVWLIMGMLAGLLMLSACQADPIQREASANQDVSVVRLTTWDDCVLWRIQDGQVGRPVYVARCGKDVSANWNQKQGKTSHPMSVPTLEKP